MLAPYKVSATPWLVVSQSRPQARLRLFCFPYAGGGAAIFRDWPRLLPPTIELFAVQLPGRGNRFHEPLRRDVAGIVRDLATAMEPFLDRPYVTFGHSLGTILSYELIRELARRGLRSPRHAFMSGRGAPGAHRRTVRHLQPDHQFLDTLRNMRGTHDELLRDPELMELLMPTIRADFALAENYVCNQPMPLPCTISV